MQQHNGYWISGTAVPGPPYTTYWEALGIVLKSGRSGSVVELGRIRDPDETFELKELAAIWGIEVSRIVVVERIPLSHEVVIPANPGKHRRAPESRERDF